MNLKINNMRGTCKDILSFEEIKENIISGNIKSITEYDNLNSDGYSISIFSKFSGHYNFRTKQFELKDIVAFLEIIDNINYSLNHSENFSTIEIK